MTLHALAGLPRSGSTLLGNILAQHPDVFVSGTSVVGLCLERISQVLTNNPEMVGHLRNVDGAYDDYLAAMNGFVGGWYRDEFGGQPHVVDKNRAWASRPELLRQLDPDAVLIVPVRDPREVFASIEQRHRETPVFYSNLGATMFERAEKAMAPDGLIGSAIRWTEDLFRKRTQAVYVEFEALVQTPDVQVEKVAQAMGLESFDWDFEHITNVATDLDEIHRLKYPHKGDGAIRPPEKHWSEVLDPELAKLIMSPPHIQHYLRTFGYRADEGWNPPAPIRSRPSRPKPRPAKRTNAKPAKKPAAKVATPTKEKEASK